MRYHSLLLCLLLSVLISGCHEGDSDDEARVLIERLARQLKKMARNGEHPKLRVSVKGQRLRLPLLDADAYSLKLTPEDGEGEVVVRWDQLAPREVLGIARATAGDDPKRLMLTGQLAIEFGKLDEGGEFLMQAYLADPKYLSKARKLVKKLSPLSGSPMADARNDKLPTLKPSQLHPDHPRLFLRNSSWGKEGRGLTVAEVRARASRKAYRPYLEFLDQKPYTPATLALKYLAEGDTDAAETAVDLLQKKVHANGTTGDGDALEETAIAFDWLATYPAFKGERRRLAIENIAAAAERLMRMLEVGGHIYHTRMYAWANGVTFAGLALMGEHDRAEIYLNFGYRYWLTRLFPARRFQGGAWHNSFAYGRKYMVRSTFSFLSVWRSAADIDMWKVVREQQGGWAQEMFYYILYTLRRDGSHPRYGDCFTASARAYDVPLALQYAAETSDPYATGYAAHLLEHYGPKAMKGITSGQWKKYGLLYFDPQAPQKKPDDLPKARLFGQKGMGCVVMRSGWGEFDNWIFFKCGNYFGNHGHPDQGHFEIFRWRPLLLDAGYYDGMSTPHAINYFKRAIAHNTILISDPNDPRDVGNQRQFSYQVAGSMPAYHAATQCETGDILSFKDADEYAWVVGDVTKAYDAHTVQQFTRTLVWLKDSNLLVFDTVKTVKPNRRVRFLLHYPSTPKIVDRQFTIANKHSRLVGCTLLPRQAKITDLPGFEVNGKQFPPRRGGGNKSWAGAGHLEISPAKPQGQTTCFLHLFTMGEAKVVVPKPEVTEHEASIEVRLLGKKILFSTDGSGVTVE